MGPDFEQEQTMAETEPEPIPAHRHEIVTRSGEPRTIEGGDDDAPARSPKRTPAPETKRAD